MGRGFASKSFKPSAEADGKREVAPQGLPSLMQDHKKTGGIGHP